MASRCLFALDQSRAESHQSRIDSSCCPVNTCTFGRDIDVYGVLGEDLRGQPQLKDRVGGVTLQWALTPGHFIHLASDRSRWRARERPRACRRIAGSRSSKFGTLLVIGSPAGPTGWPIGGIVASSGTTIIKEDNLRWGRSSLKTLDGLLVERVVWSLPLIWETEPCWILQTLPKSHNQSQMLKWRSPKD